MGEKMADPHNEERYGETWDSFLIRSYLWEFWSEDPQESLHNFVIFSGGWAWHFMSPVGHTEFKHIHDHKDADVFVLPPDVPKAIDILGRQGFKKVNTRFDKLPDNSDFRRYEKTTKNGKNLIIDFFVRKDLQVREVSNQGVFGFCKWKVVEPQQLLTFYKSIHSSDNCFAVKAAADLLAKGIDPVGRSELAMLPKEYMPNKAVIVYKT